MKPHTLFALLLVAACSLYGAQAQTTGMMMKQPGLVNARCKPLEPYQRAPHIYLSGQWEWATSPPGGPVSYGTTPLRRTKLHARRVGCSFPEPEPFVRDGDCDKTPRFRWSGKAKPGQAYEIVYEGSVMAWFGRARPNAPEPSDCPAPPAPPYDEARTLPGYPKSASLTLQASDIEERPGHYGPLVALVGEEALGPYFTRGLPREPYLQLTVNDFHAYLKDKAAVTFTVEATRKQRRREFIDYAEHDDVLMCAHEQVEHLKLSLPGVPGAWEVEDTLPGKNTPGPCPRFK